MCGICGIYGQSNTADIVKMVPTLRHRGPEDSGTFDDGICSLGHTRLAILDLSPLGREPMSNEDGSIQMVMNGEIYNYKDLRSQLESKGHVFLSKCDAEVIPHAYEEWGEWFVERLRGMFALAVYDQKNRRLVLARDPMGKKPLYYFRNGNNLVFGSEIKALFPAGVPKVVNYAVIPSYLLYQYTMGNDTMFEGVHKLPASHFLTIEIDGYMRLHRYFFITDKSMKESPYSSLRPLLEESVKLRLQSDVPIGGFLSGGVDSSAVMALYRQFYTGKFHTFTATFEQKSEAKYAQKVANCLGLLYHEVPITPYMVGDDLNAITWHHDEPLGDAATINNYYLAKEAKKYVTVVLAGEGGDEVFGGYPWYGYCRSIERMMRIPWFFRLAGHDLLKMAGLGNVASRFYGKGRVAQFPCQQSLVEMILYPETATGDLTLDWMLQNKQYVVNPIVTNGMRSLYNKMLALDCLNLLPEKFLMKADKATMAWAIEERLPLLDKEVVKFAFASDVTLKKDKYMLRKAVEDLLPQEIVWRPKQGFGTPIGHWMVKPPLKDFVMEGLLNGSFLRSICEPDALEAVAHTIDVAEESPNMMALSPLNLVWSLFALEIWYQVWF